MISQLTGALVRAVLVMVLIATPSLLLPHVSHDTTQIVALVALFAAALTFFEYASTYPGLVEFRDAPPFNRLRFLSLFVTVLILSTIVRGQTEPTTLTVFIEALGNKLGEVIDVPYSPVRLVVLMLPEDMSLRHLILVRTSAGISYMISLMTLILFVVTMRVIGWPSRIGSFNVWINLPTFDPTAGNDDAGADRPSGRGHGRGAGGSGRGGNGRSVSGVDAGGRCDDRGARAVNGAPRRCGADAG